MAQRRNENLTFLLFDDDNPHQQESFTLHPGKLALIIAGANLVLILLVVLVLYFTPAGSMLFNKENRAIRSSVMEVSERVMALRDSLEVRDRQLKQMQQVIRTAADTSFIVNHSDEWMAMYGDHDHPTDNAGERPITFRFTGSPDMQPLGSDQILYSEIFSGTVTFPAEPPVDGTLTGTYRPYDGHFGIDIASRKGADVRSVADGVVISSDWSINNGYVLHILHGGGIVSVYKHFSKVFNVAGDVVRKGDVIGTVGETGLLASGPHIHFELWQNGVSLDPVGYLLLNN
ncbi:M23 family metallopeptidase [Balneolales bacterium ANBcel1]|nr:M23 family metallopeptidase [Balneolales bacterium ANBcel1]